MSFDKYDETVSMIARLKAFKNPLTFSEKISLVKLEEANELYKAAIIEKNAALLVADSKTEALSVAAEHVNWVHAKLRSSEGIVSDNESDIFVVLGGTRQSAPTRISRSTPSSGLNPTPTAAFSSAPPIPTRSAPSMPTR